MKCTRVDLIMSVPKPVLFSREESLESEPVRSLARQKGQARRAWNITVQQCQVGEINTPTEQQRI